MLNGGVWGDGCSSKRLIMSAQLDWLKVSRRQTRVAFHQNSLLLPAVTLITISQICAIDVPICASVQTFSTIRLWNGAYST